MATCFAFNDLGPVNNYENVRHMTVVTWQLDDGKTVTLNLWEDIWSLWLSGDGKRQWYQREFQDLYTDVINGRCPGE